MTWHLDSRQRAMLAEMGLRIWVPAASIDTQVEPLAHVPRQPQPLATPVAHPAATLPQPVATAPPLPRPVATPPPRVAVSPAPSTAAGETALQPLLYPPRRLYAPAASATVSGTVSGPAWLILAEGLPDADPLTGDAGTLLHQMLRALQLHQQPGVFFSPVALQAGASESAAAHCASVLAAALSEVRPAIVLVMGRLAARAALGRSDPLGQLRAQPHVIAGVPTIVTYDAPYLLRAPHAKPAAWADLCRALALARASHTPASI